MDLDKTTDQKYGINECLKDNGNCSRRCKDLNIGYICECPKGYELDPSGKKCVDINECHIFGHYSQGCVNFKGSYACNCNKGYSLDPDDGRTCRTNGPEPYLYITNRFDIRKLSTYGGHTKVVTETQQVSALAVNQVENMVYYDDHP